MLATIMSPNESIRYAVKRMPIESRNGLLESAAWAHADAAAVDRYRDEGSSHRPGVSAGLLYDDVALYLKFTVSEDRVRCVRTEYQDSVCRDSCVEFFVCPREGDGYFNFEINAIGTMLLYHVEDPEVLVDGLGKYTAVLREHVDAMTIETTLSSVIDPPDSKALDWEMAARIPYAVFEPYIGAVEAARGDAWRANFYKCGDDTGHPHWASWAPIGPELNFHAPDYFGTIVFA